MNKTLNEPKIPKAVAHNIEASGPILMHPSPKRVKLQNTDFRQMTQKYK